MHPGTSGTYADQFLGLCSSTMTYFCFMIALNYLKPACFMMLVQVAGDTS